MVNNSNKLMPNLAIFLVVFVLVSNIPAYMQAQRIGFVEWHFWLGGLAILGALIIFAGSISLEKYKIPYLAWNALFFTTACLSLLLVYNGQESMEQFIQYGWISAIGAGVVLASKNEGQMFAVGYGLVAAVLLLATLSMMEFVDPNFQVIVDRYFEDKYLEGTINRSGALFQSPNANGHAMVLGMFVGQFFLPPRLRLLFLVFIGAGIFCTVSRASLATWGLAVFLTLLLGLGSNGKVVGRLLGLIGVVSLGALLVSGALPSLLVQLNLDQYMDEDMLGRLSQNFFTQSDGSTDVRGDVALAVWGTFVDNPILGVGLGGTDAWHVNVGSHNQHLKVAAEQGILGWLVFGSLIVVALHRKSTAAIVFVLLFFALCFTSHNMLSFPAFAILIPAGVVFLPRVLKPEKSRIRRRRRRRAASEKSNVETHPAF